MTTDTAAPELSEGDVILLESGEIRFFRGWQAIRDETYAKHSPADASAPYTYTFAPRGSFEPAPVPSARNGYDIAHHLLPRVFGWKAWGHVEAMPPWHVANLIPGWAGRRGILDGVDPAGAPGGYRSWATFFPVAGQGGGYTGEAYVLAYSNGGTIHDPEAARALAEAVRESIDGKPAPGNLAAALAAYDATRKYGSWPRAYRVAVCKHEKVVGAGANPMRGWHPGSCRLCGMDMSVDSGD